jgi:hypothetical protein
VAGKIEVGLAKVLGEQQPYTDLSPPFQSEAQLPPQPAPSRRRDKRPTDPSPSIEKYSLPKPLPTAST